MAKKQLIHYVDFERTIKTIDEVVSKHVKRSGAVNWGLEPLAVVSLLYRNASKNGERYVVSYHTVRKILDKAVTPKMGGNMNRGLGEIKETVRKQKFTLQGISNES